MPAFTGPEGWAREREAEWERLAECGLADEDDFALQLEEQEFVERYAPLPPAVMERASRAGRRPRVTDLPVPSYVKRSAT